MKLVEYSDPRTFDQRVGRWLMFREAENSFIIGMLPELIAQWTKSPAPARFFAVEDNASICAAAVLLKNGMLLLTWATPEMVDVLLNDLIRHQTGFSAVYGPGHVSLMAGRKYAALTGTTCEVGRAERIYQLVRLTYMPQTSGRLVLATAAQAGMLVRWTQGFIREADYENTDATGVVGALIAARLLFIWEEPDPVAMAAWVCPTPHGGCINFVYTPSEYRGNGFGTSVVAALAQKMLTSGKRYCFINTDPADSRTNHIYQKIGARTLCELMRCRIISPPIQAAAGQQGS